MGSIQELGRNMGKFTKKNAGALVISTVLSVDTVGYEMVVREGKDIAPIAESINQFMKDHTTSPTIPDCRTKNPDGTPRCGRIMPPPMPGWG